MGLLNLWGRELLPSGCAGEVLGTFLWVYGVSLQVKIYEIIINFNFCELLNLPSKPYKSMTFPSQMQLH